MGSITVDGNAYDVYGDLAGATLYIAGLVTPGAVAWRAAVANEKQRFLLSARILLDQQSWAGSKTVALQTLAWPRTDVYYADGTAVDSATIPTEVINAEYEMACILAGDASAYAAATSGSNVKRLKAGPLEIENFVSTIMTATALPKNVTNYIGQFLASVSGARAGIVSGEDDDSSFTDCDTYTRTGAF